MILYFLVPPSVRHFVSVGYIIGSVILITFYNTMPCQKCKSDIPSGKEAIKCSNCGSSYHLGCCGIGTVGKLKKMSENAIAAWRCAECVTDVPGSSDNEDSPLVVELLRSLKKEMEDNRKFNSEKFDNIERGISTVSLSLEDLKSKITVVEAENAQLKSDVKTLNKENESLSRRVWDLESDLSDLQQYSRINNLEIRGIPPTRGEDIYSVLQSVAGAIGVTYQRQDISVAHRLPAPRDKRFHPSVVVQLVSRTTRSQWILAAKQKKTRASDLVTTFPPTPVFICDHLTGHNRAVLGHAKSLARQGKLAYAWSKDGKIFIRKTAESPAVRVRTKVEIEERVTAAEVATQ